MTCRRYSATSDLEISNTEVILVASVAAIEPEKVAVNADVRCAAVQRRSTDEGDFAARSANIRQHAAAVNSGR